MPTLLAQRDADHHLRPLVIPTRPAEDRAQCLKHHFVVADHHPPRRRAGVSQVNPRAFVDQPPSQCPLGYAAQSGSVLEPRRPVDRDQPVGKRARRHVGRGNLNRSEQRWGRRAISGERGQRRDLEQPVVDRTIDVAFEPSLDDGLHCLERLGLGRLGHRKTGLRRHRQGIGSQRLRPRPFAGEVADQPVAILIGRQRSRKRSPCRRIAEHYRTAELLFETVIGIGG